MFRHHLQLFHKLQLLYSYTIRIKDYLRLAKETTVFAHLQIFLIGLIRQEKTSPENCEGFDNKSESIDNTYNINA